jgi:dCMP deaminase
MNWDELFIKQAMLIAEKSKDSSTKVGCVIVGDGNAVLSMGFNGFPRGVIEDEFEWTKFIKSEALDDFTFTRWNRPEKYSWIEHAERNAVYNAARNGIRLAGARMYLNFEPMAMCADCTRAMIQSGIKEIIGPDIPFAGKGAGTHYHLSYSGQMLEEAGVKVRIVKWSKE